MNPLKQILIRRVTTVDGGYFGIIHKDKIPFALTAERSWQNNQANVSCIPKGEYLCKRVIKPKFGETFEVTGVMNREDILFHCGNIPEVDSHGCILLGDMFGQIDGKTSVLSSRQAFIHFMAYLNADQEFKLIIEESPQWVS